MRTVIQRIGAIILLSGLAAITLIAADPLPASKSATSPKGMALPEYDGEGKLLRTVYLQPEAFDYYVENGEFPEQSVFIVTNNPSHPAKTKGAVSRLGFVAAPTSGLEIAIKDSKKYPDKWAYFMFHDKPDQSPSRVRSAEAAFERKECFDCHQEHGAVDNVFTQFYSVLTEARENQVQKDHPAK